MVTDVSSPTLPEQPRKTLRTLYAAAMDPDQRRRLEDDLNEDRYDLTGEIAMLRDGLARLVAMEAQILRKYPDRTDLLLPIKAQQQEVINDIVRNTKGMREVENAGQVYTADKIAALLDKVASIVMYRVSDAKDRQLVIDDIMDLMVNFRRSYERGTLITPDQDAMMMDDTVPAPNILTLEAGRPA